MRCFNFAFVIYTHSSTNNTFFRITFKRSIKQTFKRSIKQNSSFTTELFSIDFFRDAFDQWFYILPIVKSNLLSKRSLFFRSKGILCADIECKKFKEVKKRKENDKQR